MKTKRNLLLTLSAAALGATLLCRAETVTLTSSATVDWDKALWVVDGVVQDAGYIPSTSADVYITNTAANQAVRPNVSNYVDPDTGKKYLLVNSLTYDISAGWVEVQSWSGSGDNSFSYGSNPVTQAGTIKVAGDFTLTSTNLNSFIAFNSRATGVAMEIDGNIVQNSGNLYLGGSNASNMGGVTGLEHITVGGNVYLKNNTMLKISTINGQVLDAEGNQTGIANAVIKGSVEMAANSKLSVNDDATNLETTYGNATTKGSAINQIVKVAGVNSTEASSVITTTTTRSSATDPIATAHAYTGTLEISGNGLYSYSGIVRDKEISESASKVSVIMNSESGSGTQILGGTNSYTGDTVVKSGTLLMGSISADSKLVLQGGDFGATGANKLSINNVEWSGGGFAFDLSSENYTLDIGSISGEFSADMLGDFIFANIGGETYELISLENANSDFAAAFDGASALFNEGGKQFEAIFSATDNSLSVSFSQVPEPATYAAIFGVLSLALAAYKRRK